MKILIIGAGRIGSAVAESLSSEANDITVVDQNPERIKDLQNKLDMRGIVGDATSPTVLDEANAHDADMILAVTASDETNMVVCLLAGKIYNIPTRIARVRNSALRSYPKIMGDDGFMITSTIWPEQSLVDALSRLIEFPEALQIIDFADGKVNLFSMRAVAGAPLVGRQVGDLALHLPKASARIVSVYRRNRLLELDAETVIESGDEVIALVAGRDLRRVMNEFRRHEDPVRSIVLAGNLELSLQLAKVINSPESRRTYDIKILDKHISEETVATDMPPRTIPVAGSLTVQDDLESIDIDTCGLFIALTQHDELNIMASLLAKKLGARSVIALTNNQKLGDLLQGTQIDSTVSTTQATISNLLRHVRRGDVVAAHSLRRGMSEALEIVAHGNKKSSRVVGRRLDQIDLPPGVSIAAVVRENRDGTTDDPTVIMASSSLVIEDDDHIILFVPHKRVIPKIEKLFAVDVGFF